MKKLIFAVLLIPILLFSHEIVIHNRPLVKVNGKNISLIDVVKKMNAFLYANFPDATQDQAQLYQFYNARWRQTLDDMINNELMLIEAQTREVKVSDGDVREEVEARFGPNIMAALDKLHMSLDEAREMVHTDLIVQRIMWLHVHQKVYQEITPQKQREAYAAFLQANPPTDQWIYQVLSVRGEDVALCKKITESAVNLIETVGKDLVQIKTAIVESHKEEPAFPVINVSEDYVVENSRLSEEHRNALLHLTDGDFSAPIAQLSRSTGKEVWRIFHLKERKTITPPTFDDVADNLKNHLQQESYQRHSEAYYKKLRSNYQLRLDIPDDYEPFQIH